MAQYQRELERQARAHERAQSQAIREAERAQKAYQRAIDSEEKERKRLYVESQVAQVVAQNDELGALVARLENLLRETLDVDDYIDFDALKMIPELPPFQPGALARPEPTPQIDDFLPDPPAGLGKLLPGTKAKHEQAVEAGRASHEHAMVEYRKREDVRQRSLEEAREAHEREKANMLARAAEANEQVDAFRAHFLGGEPEALVEYFSLVLDASSYPDGFPRQHRMAFVPESKQLVVELELPGLDTVPQAREYKYVRARDEIQSTRRPASQIKALYAQIVAQTTLRTLHELFEADRTEQLETIVFNGFVNTIDPTTGHPARPHLISLRTTRELFLSLDLLNVEPLACLKGLNASVSRSPSELVPVRPVLEFNMVDPRFIQESDVLGTLDPRPNLMELSPTEFESLISNLFEKMGLETRQTQASRDGGVDCVAYDPRPILGGKVVIQAKRYKNTVGVSAVRDLFGTMQNEGASKGILVTTSGYGKASFEFGEGKPLELLSGTNLLYLLAEHAGIEARIEPPEDWVDPVADLEADEPTSSLATPAHIPA